MKICGIIAEYNPFHNGHLHHIREAKALSGADYTVCVMSGNFTQRGEPAIFDKWIRAEAALAGGADIVAELPLLSALQSAEGFARGGVRLLNALGADCISFGSETADARLFLPRGGAPGRRKRRFQGAFKAIPEKRGVLSLRQAEGGGRHTAVYGGGIPYPLQPECDTGIGIRKGDDRDRLQNGAVYRKQEGQLV